MLKGDCSNNLLEKRSYDFVLVGRLQLLKTPTVPRYWLRPL